LAGLWLRGQWTSLVVAIGFSLLLNFALVSTFVWPALLASEWKIVIWPVVLFSWLVFGWISWRFLDQPQVAPETLTESDDTLFNQAQDEYLKGEMTQAELLLAQRLQKEPRDAEARLLLAAICRRSGRHSNALHQLGKLRKLDNSIRWQFEIDREEQLIEAAWENSNESIDDSLEQSQQNESLQDEDLPDGSDAPTLKLGEAAALIDKTANEDNQKSNSEPDIINPNPNSPFEQPRAA